MAKLTTRMVTEIHTELHPSLKGPTLGELVDRAIQELVDQESNSCHPHSIELELTGELLSPYRASRSKKAKRDSGFVS